MTYFGLHVIFSNKKYFVFLHDKVCIYEAADLHGYFYMGGIFDKKFEQKTALLFDMVKVGQFVCLYSDITENELMNAPKKVLSFFESFPDEQKEKLVITPEILKLAKMYVNENVVGKTSFDDCVHIATATVYRADLLISWNFKHIVNIYRARGYNAINLKLGYPILNIHSPKEIVSYGNEN